VKPEGKHKTNSGQSGAHSYQSGRREDEASRWEAGVGGGWTGQSAGEDAKLSHMVRTLATGKEGSLEMSKKKGTVSFPR